jgi:serine/threonine protein kinase
MQMLPKLMKHASTDSQVTKKKSQLSDYKIIKSIGEGAFGEVYLVKHIVTEKTYALKCIDKNFLAKHKKEHHVFQEKLILQALSYPYVVKLYATFQDESKLYFLLENISNGELSSYIRAKSTLNRKASNQRGQVRDGKNN